MMRLSFEDQESLKEAVRSICFNNPPSNSNLNIQWMGSSSMPPQGQERSEDTDTVPFSSWVFDSNAWWALCAFSVMCDSHSHESM